MHGLKMLYIDVILKATRKSMKNLRERNLRKISFQNIDRDDACCILASRLFLARILQMRGRPKRITSMKRATTENWTNVADASS